MPLFAGSNLVKVNSSKNKFKANFYIKPSTLAAKDNWYKGTTAKNTITEINIVDSYIPTGSETETWNADTTNIGRIKCYIDGTKLIIAGNNSGKIMCNLNAYKCFGSFTKVLNINGLSLLDTSKVINMSAMFSNCSKLTSLDVSNFDTSKVTNMSYMFNEVNYYCTEKCSLDLSNWNTSNVTDMSYMFNYYGYMSSNPSKNCILNLSNWNTSKVTNMSYMFNYFSHGIAYTTAILNLDNWDTSKVTNMSYMFHRALRYLKGHFDLTNWDTSKVTNMSHMFYGASVTSLDLNSWDTSNVTDMSYMFIACNDLVSIDVSSFNTSKVTNMSAMFNSCYRLTSLDLSSFNTSNVTNMSAMFSGCSKLVSLDLSNWDTSNVTNMSYMFNMGTTTNLLTTIYASELWSTDSCTDSGNMFKGCTSLVGDIPFDSNYTDKTYATTTGGYLTYKAASNT